HFLWNHISDETTRFINHIFENVSSLIIPPFYGLHIRRTDKKFEAKYKSTLDYITGLEKLLSSGNKSKLNVFIATDDSNIMNEIIQLKPAWNFFRLINRDPRRHDLANDQKLYETRIFMSELTLMIKAQGIVCTMSSNVCRLIQILRYQSETTVLSLDTSWHAEK
ncbi:unnamed protein product, partial [Didymodactylos carnosus]